MLIGSYADNNSRANSGSTFVIYDSILKSYSSTGNNLDLATAANYHIRFDGDANDRLAGAQATGDFNNNGKADLLIGAVASCSWSGGLFVIYDTILDDYTGAGNAVDLSDADNYNLEVCGPGGFLDLVANFNGVNAADLG